MVRGNLAKKEFSRPLSIGQVLALLQRNFPDLTASKLRFLEEQKLITLERAASGYRRFYPEDVERIRTILTIQRDEYLPLKVIRARMEARLNAKESSTERSSAAVEAPPAAKPIIKGPRSAAAARASAARSSQTGGGRAAAPPTVAKKEQPVTPEKNSDKDSIRNPGENWMGAFTSAAFPYEGHPNLQAWQLAQLDFNRVRRPELIKLVGVEPSLFTDAVTAGLIEPAEYYGAETIELMTSLKLLAEKGISPRHLSGIKNTVDRMADLVGYALRPLQEKPGVRKTENSQPENGQFESTLELLILQLHVVQRHAMRRIKRRINRQLRPPFRDPGKPGVKSSPRS